MPKSNVYVIVSMTKKEVSLLIMINDRDFQFLINFLCHLSGLFKTLSTVITVTFIKF